MRKICLTEMITLGVPLVWEVHMWHGHSQRKAPIHTFWKINMPFENCFQCEGGGNSDTQHNVYMQKED